MYNLDPRETFESTESTKCSDCGDTVVPEWDGCEGEWRCQIIRQYAMIAGSTTTTQFHATAETRR